MAEIYGNRYGDNFPPTKEEVLAAHHRRVATDPRWAIYSAAYKILCGHDPDGYGLSPPAMKIADEVMKNVIPKFFTPKLAE